MNVASSDCPTATVANFIIDRGLTAGYVQQGIPGCDGGVPRTSCLFIPSDRSQNAAPPFTQSVAPVMYFASRLVRKTQAAAMSSGFPK